MLAHGTNRLRSYNVGCTKRMGLFPNRKTSLENLKKQRALNGGLKNCTVDSKKKVRPEWRGAGLSTRRCVPEKLFQSQSDFYAPPPALQKPSAATPSTGHSALPAQAESSQCSDLSGYKRPPSPPPAPRRLSEGPEEAPCPYNLVASDPGQWNIDDVYEFISSLPGGLGLWFVSGVSGGSIDSTATHLALL